MASEKAEHHDLIIIGAGLYGLQAARTYLEVHPTAAVAVFEAAEAIGGVWSKPRMYNAFQTQTPLRIAEFSDRPLRGVPKDEQYFDFFPARYLTGYFEDYADNHVYANRTLRSRIRLNSTVERVEKVDGLWRVAIQDRSVVHLAPKLIDASGLTSDPNIPRIPGLSEYKGLTLHQKAFGQSDVLSNPAIRDVVVLGGAKSAADMAYASAKAGKRVSWVIRRSGCGPAALVPAAGGKYYRNSNDSTYTRFFASLLASIFTKPGWLSDFIFKTRVGLWLHRRWWADIDKAADDLAQFSHPKRQINGFQLLKTDLSIVHQQDSSGVCQRPDYFDIISNNVKVYREDVVQMTETALQTTNHEIPCDALMFATGWVSKHPYLDPQLATSLGLPSDDLAADAAHWGKLDAQADAETLSRFPHLANPPRHWRYREKSTPFRLYKTILPVKDHSIAFLGKTMLGNNFRNAEVQALWATAALDGTLKLPSPAEMERDISRVVAWCRRRYLAKGAQGNWFYFDVVPYSDNLLSSLSLSSHRKKSWLRDFFEPCLAIDLAKMIPEYRHKYVTEPKKM